MLIALTLLFTLCILWFLLCPLWCTQCSTTHTHTTTIPTTLLDQRERYLQSLRDLELDHHTHKITAQEYQELKHLLTTKLAAVLERIDTYQS